MIENLRKIMIGLISCVLLCACRSAGIPSKNDVISQGKEWTESAVSSHEREDLIEAWGEPDEIKTIGSSTLMIWISEAGTISISDDSNGIHIIEVSHNLNTEVQSDTNGMALVIRAVLAATLPFILIFTIVILSFKKAGWMNAGNPDKKAPFFAREPGSKPWSGI